MDGEELQNMRQSSGEKGKAAAKRILAESDDPGRLRALQADPAPYPPCLTDALMRGAESVRFVPYSGAIMRARVQQTVFENKYRIGRESEYFVFWSSHSSGEDWVGRMVYGRRHLPTPYANWIWAAGVGRGNSFMDSGLRGSFPANFAPRGCEYQAADTASTRSTRIGGAFSSLARAYGFSHSHDLWGEAPTQVGIGGLQFPLPPNLGVGLIYGCGDEYGRPLRRGPEGSDPRMRRFQIRTGKPALRHADSRKITPFGPSCAYFSRD